MLPIGTDVWVVDGPVVAADYEWFQVLVPGADGPNGTPRVGWVAASDHGGEPWLAKGSLDCPGTGARDVVDLVDLPAPPPPGLRGLACYGSSKLRFEGIVGLTCGDETHPGWTMTPEWLSGNAEQKLRIEDGDTSVVAHPHPGLALPIACGETALGRYILEGHFDDETAAECDAAVAAGPQPQDLFLVAEYWCRTTLVIDRLAQAPSEGG